jgi:hypothetical protein
VQLVVYASALDGDVGGLALINLAGTGIRYSAIGRDPEWGGVEPALWQQRLGDWKATVDDALERFAAGDVSVNVARSSDASRPLSVLSRVEELQREP